MIGVLSIGIVFVCRLLLVHICKVEQGSAGAKIIFNVLCYSVEITPVVCSLNRLFQKKSTGGSAGGELDLKVLPQESIV